MEKALAFVFSVCYNKYREIFGDFFRFERGVCYETERQKAVAHIALGGVSNLFDWCDFDFCDRGAEGKFCIQARAGSDLCAADARIVGALRALLVAFERHLSQLLPV